MKCWILLAFALGLAWSTHAVPATDDVFIFEDSVLEKRYNDFIKKIRCLVCQNQSLADSNAALAHDLKKKIYEKIKNGEDNNQINQFLVERYGDFVLYQPPLKADTWFLWFGPFIILLIAIIATIKIINKQLEEK